MSDTPPSGARDQNRARLLALMPKGGTAAEIGVWEGQFSRRILADCCPDVLHLIDPWAYMPEFSNTGFGKKKNAGLMEQKFQQVTADFRDEPRVIIHRTTSQQALSALADESLDWVYIDGNHNEPFVSEDIALCLKKVKKNGIIAGDDYNWMTEELGAPVKRAVARAMAQLGDQASLKVMANQWIMRLNRA